MGLSKVILTVISLKYFLTAEWQSGYAADCNSVYIGSIPFSASNITAFIAIELELSIIALHFI